MEHIVKVLSVTNITNDVLKIQTTKPGYYSYYPGQATDVSLNREGWKHELRPFTFTSLTNDDHLEFTTKTYPERNGVTNELLGLRPNDELILHDVFGDIAYKGEGLFIAGGAGITPFIAIFRDIEKKGQVGNNKLIFANKTKADIIHEAWFKNLLGSRFINVLSAEVVDGYEHGYINKDLISAHLKPGDKVYLCGPTPMMEAVEKTLAELGIEGNRIIKEGF